MFLIRRPFIALTLAYIAALLAADHCGFFSPPTASLKAPGALQGEVIRPPEEKNGRFSFILKPVQPGAGNVLVITRSPDEKIDAGDRLELTGTFRRPHRASNDGGFDYAAYLARSNIFALFYPDTIARTAHRNVPWYWQLARAVRADIIRTIEAHVPAENARVLIPMIVGGTEGVPREITNEFNSSGVMHILVVSGLNGMPSSMG
jgi:competence protein ComEC